MTRRLGVLLLVVVAVLGAAGAAPAATPRTSLDAIEGEVMCVTCGTALNVSEAPSADAERAFIERQIAQGKTKAQVKAALVEQYGPNVLATPRSDTAWLVPLLAALAALAAVAFTVARWRRRGARTGYRNPDDAPADPVADLDPADAARLDRDMAAFDR